MFAAEAMSRRGLLQRFGKARVGTAPVAHGPLFSTQANRLFGSGSPERRPPCPPFTLETAKQKVRMAENAWNTKDPHKVKMAYTPDTRWRNRNVFLNGRDEVAAFLISKWQREQEYRLIKEIWCHSEDKIAVRFVYEYRDDSFNWFRAHGNENWKFDRNGLMEERHASINEVVISEAERKFRWSQGVRPDDHPDLSDLGLYLSLTRRARGVGTLAKDMIPKTDKFNRRLKPL
eukprot:g19796.t1